MSRALHISLTLAVVVLGFGLAAVAVDETDKADKVKELREQRLAVLNEIHNFAASGFQSGEMGAEAVHRAKLDVLQAQLELAQGKRERVALFEQAISEGEKWEALVGKHVEAGEASRADLLRAKALVLSARIDLAKATTAD